MAAEKSKIGVSAILGQMGCLRFPHDGLSMGTQAEHGLMPPRLWPWRP